MNIELKTKVVQNVPRINISSFEFWNFLVPIFCRTFLAGNQNRVVVLFSCLCSKVTVYRWKWQWVFWTSSSSSSSPPDPLLYSLTLMSVTDIRVKNNKIVRKFSQKIILLRKSNLLGQLKINVKQSSLPTRGKSQLHLFCYRLLYINKLLHCYTTIKNVCMLNRAKRLTEPFPCFPTKATLCGRLLYCTILL